MRLLVTRPEPDAQRTAAVLRRRGHEVTIAPLLRIEPLAADLGSPPWDGLVMTSANSCRASASHPQRAELLGLPVFVVGRYSAEAARVAGFTDVTSADGDVRQLADLLKARFGSANRRLLYLAGEDRAADLAGELATEGIAMKTVVIYRAVKLAEFPYLARHLVASDQIDGILHYSRRTAESYIACAAGSGILDRALKPFHYCLSAQAARPLMQAGATAVRVASRPEESALLELIGAAR